MKNITVGIKKANAAVEFKVINLDYEGFNEPLGHPNNIFAFQVPFFTPNIVMFTFKADEDEFSDYNAFGYNTPILFISKEGHFVNLDDADIYQIETILKTEEIQKLYTEEDYLHENQK